ncbi:MAG: hypothetical protein OXB94_13620 [Nitrospira sp.]|nr:hypothetical protein [Nitrospira sp.]
MPQPVAEAFVSNYTKYLLGNLATKQDIQESNQATTTAIAQVHHAIELLRKDTTAATELLRKDAIGATELLRKDTTTAIELLRKDAIGATELLRKDTTTATEALRKETQITITQLETKLIRWVVGTGVGLGLTLSSIIVGTVFAAYQMLSP